MKTNIQRMPTQKQWQKVIDNFYSILPFTFDSSCHLDMTETRVNDYSHKCGTIHCVGGWYLIAVKKEELFDPHPIENFQVGATFLARDLGFRYYDQLEDWARKNPVLWGNVWGGLLFNEADAYDHGNGPAKSITDIISHFEFVKQKCAQYEKISPSAV